jgi:uncharacterized protein
MTLLLLLCFFAFLAGFVDAMVGGGGLIQLPAMFLLQPQLSLLQTLATNKTASFFGTSVSTVKYLRRVEINWKHLSPAIVSAFAGSFGGALLVSYIHKEQFMPFIICVLFLVLLYTIMKKHLGLHHIDKQLSQARYLTYAISMGLVIGFYDGLIGPGTGSFLIFSFVLLFGYNFLHASANAKVINCVTNIAALSFFLMQDGIVWTIALPVGAANMLGSYIGAHFALKKGSGFIRIFFIVVVLALILKLGYDYL